MPDPIASPATNPRVSVIVPLHRLTPAARQCIETVVGLAGDSHELLVVSDKPVEGIPAAARAIVTGSPVDTSPAEKRDLAVEHARGDICAFLDDDAYPAADWIDKALERFEDPTIAAVGGPGATPPGAPLRERLGGAFYESALGSGGLRYRFTPVGEVRDVDDYPAYNFFVRTAALRDVGGWASRFYGGEDTKLCLALVRGGHRIVYDPEVLVYHHRRPMFRAHMRQVGNVGRHRGWFVHAFPETSRRAVYFAPAGALVATPLIAAWAVRDRRRAAKVGAIGAFASSAIAASALRDGQDPFVAALLPVGLAAGHAAYGAGFLRGLLFTDEIESM
ncbi:MAG: glycosyltransferase family 2 protein [Actinomycetota bacterium]|nr:glycosyltransferase family 2 protein [Actinomycetota bacterium]